MKDKFGVVLHDGDWVNIEYVDDCISNRIGQIIDGHHGLSWMHISEICVREHKYGISVHFPVHLRKATEDDVIMHKLKYAK